MRGKINTTFRVAHQQTFRLIIFKIGLPGVAMRILACHSNWDPHPGPTTKRKKKEILSLGPIQQRKKITNTLFRRSLTPAISPFLIASLKP